MKAPPMFIYKNQEWCECCYRMISRRFVSFSFFHFFALFVLLFWVDWTLHPNDLFRMPRTQRSVPNIPNERRSESTCTDPNAWNLHARDPVAWNDRCFRIRVFGSSNVCFTSTMFALRKGGGEEITLPVFAPSLLYPPSHLPFLFSFL